MDYVYLCGRPCAVAFQLDKYPDKSEYTSIQTSPDPIKVTSNNTRWEPHGTLSHPWCAHCELQGIQWHALQTHIKPHERTLDHLNLASTYILLSKVVPNNRYEHHQIIPHPFLLDSSQYTPNLTLLGNWFDLRHWYCTKLLNKYILLSWYNHNNSTHTHPNRRGKC